MKIDLTLIGLALIFWALAWMSVEDKRSEEALAIAKLRCIPAGARQ